MIPNYSLKKAFTISLFSIPYMNSKQSRNWIWRISISFSLTTYEWKSSNMIIKISSVFLGKGLAKSRVDEVFTLMNSFYFHITTFPLHSEEIYNRYVCISFHDSWASLKQTPHHLPFSTKAYKGLMIKRKRSFYCIDCQSSRTGKVLYLCHWMLTHSIVLGWIRKLGISKVSPVEWCQSVTGVGNCNHD